MSYDLTHETQRVIEALGIHHGDATVAAALREAYEAGRKKQKLTPFDWSKSPLNRIPQPKRR